MENNLKILFVKQSYDNLGPKSSYGYSDDFKPLELLEHFNGKTSLFESLLYYKCDFLIVPSSFGSPWLQTMIQIPGYKDFIEKNTKNVINPNNFDFGAYDIIITHDPILGPIMGDLQKKFKNTLFAFMLVEHTSWQLHQHGFEYDLFLDHTLNSVNDVVRVPQSINYVFPRTPEIVSNMFNDILPNDPKDTVFFDYRSYGYFISNGKNNVALTPENITDFNRDNFKNLKVPLNWVGEVALKPYMFVTNSDDSFDYYKKMYGAKYYVTIANRVGQAAVDAASMGCLVIGNAKSKLHNLICHKDCLMVGDFKVTDVTNLINKIESDDVYYNELLSIQNQNLKKWAVDYPIDILTSALKLKRKENE